MNRMILGMSLSISYVKDDEVDYSYYLGPDYKKSYKPPPGRVPTVIAPHVSANDSPMMQRAFDGDLSFVAGDFMLKIPLYGKLC